jgi:peptide/nickel transport system substrate-binding protein
VVALLALCVAAPMLAARAASAPAGQVTWAVHFTLAPRWLDPAESEGTITPFLTLYAVHDALLKPMPAGLTVPSWRSRGRRRPTGSSTSSCCATRGSTTASGSPPTT